MNLKTLIFVISTIVISLENDDDNCYKQLIESKKFFENDTNTDAFKRAYETMTVPKKRTYAHKTKGIRYQYQHHLLTYALTEHHREFIEQYGSNMEVECIRKMTEVGFESTARKALEHAFNRHVLKLIKGVARGYFVYMKETIRPLIKNTDAKSPMEFCNINTLPTLEGSENQYENFISDVNTQSLTSTPTEHTGPSGYASLISNELSSSTYRVDISGRQSYNQYELPSNEYEEYDDEEDEEDE